MEGLVEHPQAWSHCISADKASDIMRLIASGDEHAGDNQSDQRPAIGLVDCDGCGRRYSASVRIMERRGCRCFVSDAAGRNCANAGKTRADTGRLAIEDIGQTAEPDDARKALGGGE